MGAERVHERFAQGSASAASHNAILVVNAGSTSLKLHVVDGTDRARPVDAIESMRDAPPRAVAHRVVHGGARFRAPVVVDPEVREQIFELEALAPLHNAPALAGIDEARTALPGVPQIAVFDTGFHATMPPAAAVYPLPARWRDEWALRRYGFHGLSVEWSARRAPELLGDPRSAPRLVICHLGGGCSVSAVRDGRSVDTTMGFSPLDGVPMMTRSGSMDPGAIIYLIRAHGLDPEDVERELNVDSGLRGLAGGAGGMVELEAAARDGEEGARLALEVFVHRLAGACAAMAASAGGIDALVFTAGIGEGSALVRERLCARLAFLGVDLDADRNRDATPDCELSATSSRVRTLVIRAREELVAARAARALLGEEGSR